jgi:hypothetical protein
VHNSADEKTRRRRQEGQTDKHSYTQHTHACTLYIYSFARTSSIVAWRTRLRCLPPRTSPASPAPVPQFTLLHAVISHTNTNTHTFCPAVFPSFDDPAPVPLRPESSNDHRLENLWASGVRDAAALVSISFPEAAAQASTPPPCHAWTASPQMMSNQSQKG